MSADASHSEGSPEFTGSLNYAWEPKCRHPSWSTQTAAVLPDNPAVTVTTFKVCDVCGEKYSQQAILGRMGPL
eukprot:g65005.t1